MTTRGPLVQWLLLLAAGVASFFLANYLATAEQPDNEASALVPDVAAQTVRKAHAPDERSVGADLPVAPARESIDASATDTFASVSWAPPPPPPPVQAPPPPPTVPPLPFRFVGMLEEKADQPTAFLAKGEALHVVRAGDVIEGVYRIESLSATQIIVMYLPMQQKQTLAVAGGQP